MYIALIFITIISSLVSLYYASAALKDKKKSDTAYYAFVRSAAAVILVIFAALLNIKSLVLGSALLMALIQLGDAVVGIRISNKMKTYGPLTVAIISFIILGLNISS